MQNKKKEMTRIARVITIREEDRSVLNDWSSSRTVFRHQHERARMILGCASGQRIVDIARDLQTYPGKVRHWRNQYVLNGLSGLLDKPRSGHPVKYKNLKVRVLEALNTPVPEGYSRWDAPLLARRLDCSADAVWRVLKVEGISLHRQRSWCISTDKDFAAKAADIVGLYLHPPLNAVVLCVDEKPGIQALERKVGYIQTSDGKTRRAYKSTYKRNGTLNLLRH